MNNKCDVLQIIFLNLINMCMHVCTYVTAKFSNFLNLYENRRNDRH